MRPDLPLAEQLRPQSIHDVVGQAHLLGDGRPLQAAVASRRLHSMILWGPPGVGKTTLARLMAQGFQAEFMALSAVLSGVKDIREAVERAQLLLHFGRGIGGQDGDQRIARCEMHQGKAHQSDPQHDGQCVNHTSGQIGKHVDRRSG